MKILFGMLTSILCLASCSKDDNTVLGKWSTDTLTITTSNQNNICTANLTVAKSIDDEYVIVLEHEGKIFTFFSTSVSDGIIYIESIDDELSWHYSGEINLIDENLRMSYTYRNFNGAELPSFISEGLFTIE